MVLLAAAVCTKGGKALVSRQFVEMSRSRIEGLLSAFPKLMGTGLQHTFVETESVRYVYQPLDKLYVLLITTKASNILEDLETLRLFSRVVPEYCRVLEESEILENSYQLIFAFDEIVALGYRENVNLAQIRTFIEMDSHEERVINAVRRTQELEAKEQMKRKAKEFQRMNTSKGKFGMGSNFSSNSYSNQSRSETVAPSVGDTAQADVSTPKPTYSSSRPSGSGKAMKLGGKSKDIDSFVDKLREEGTEVISPSTTRNVSKAPTPTTPKSSVHIKVDEKVTVSVGRHGGLQNMEVRGIVLLRIADSELTKVAINTNIKDSLGFQMQTHPNVDKKMFNQTKIIGLKHPDKGFPLNNEIGVVKWRLQTKDEALIPLTINCWPNENDGECEVTIEYELQNEDLELKDVVVSIPVPSGVGGPVVGEVSGDYHYDSRKSVLDWQLPVIDSSSSQGSMEFTISGHPDDFFPINVSFYSTKTICDFEISGIVQSGNQAPIKFSQECVLLAEKYEIV